MAVSGPCETCGSAGADDRRAAQETGACSAAPRTRRPSLAGAILRSVYVLAIRRGRPAARQWP
jgi:hypothetical protein